MSLLVWYPFTQDAENRGILDLGTPSYNNLTVQTTGKLGNCYYGCRIYHLDTDILNASFTVATWVKSRNGGWNTGGNDIIFCKNYDSANANIYFSVVNGGERINLGINGSAGSAAYASCSIGTSEWVHLAATYDGSTANIYLNGELIKTATYTSTKYASHNNIAIGGRASSADGVSRMATQLYFNDFRLYDEVLSPREIKLIARGLTIHYKLSDNVNVLDNAYNKPTFDTSNANGGWAHWGRSGHQGTYGQNTDKEYIYHKSNSYSHWIADGASSTGEYLVYQSPEFDGGYRSLQCIAKEENSLPITEDILFPSWNARDGGAPNNLWTSVTHLHDGFYLCKCEGIHQDGSNDLIGFYVTPGHKVYISEAYVENNREICSDIFLPNDNIEYDVSGNGYNGTRNSLTFTKDTPRNSGAYVLNGTNSWVKVDSNDWMVQKAPEMTVNFWAYSSDWTTKYNRMVSCTEGGGWNLEPGASGYLRWLINVYTNAEQTTGGYIYNNSGIKLADLTAGYHMFTLVYTTTAHNIYIDGDLHSTYNYQTYGLRYATGNSRLYLGCESNGINPYQPFFNGMMSDFRLYYTALSEDDIKDLYQVGQSLTSSGKLLANEFVEGG